jgi:hypothetical protein
MPQSAPNLGPAFERVPLRVERGYAMPATVLRMDEALQQKPIVPHSDVRMYSDGQRVPRVSAFRVCEQGLSHEGLRTGDYLLVRTTIEVRCGTLVLIDRSGRTFLRRAESNTATSSDPGEIIGALAGVIRKRGFGRPSDENEPIGSPVPAGKVAVLRSQLGMLEMTCAGTRNPRLQRALRNEADRIRRQLQNQAIIHKSS